VHNSAEETVALLLHIVVDDARNLCGTEIDGERERKREREMLVWFSDLDHT
jgi:hypothetical protein